ncbi:unnamed protein product [Adineta ricciae]|uniref:XK-related protein n=1 Tax=Adineta ricciae TaxID=249248 RepID=A0A813XNB8_ADIRI|nr:unnamed protein product [Adineta ricciae]
MSGRQSSNEQLSMNDRSLPVDAREKNEEHQEQRYERSASNPEKRFSVTSRRESTSTSSGARQSNTSTTEAYRGRSKTTPSQILEVESTVDNPPQPSTIGSTGFNFLQSIKDLTQKELYRANPLGLLGKEVISATGTTRCPEPIPPNEDERPANRVSEDGDAITPTSSSVSSNKLSPITENEPQHIHFPLNEEEKVNMQRRRSTIVSTSEVVLPPCPAEFVENTDNNIEQPHLFSQLSPTTMVADFIPDKMTINVFEVFIYAWGVFAFFFDMVTDLVLAQAYYTEGAYWLFILTLMCVIVPNLTLSVFSLVWYIDGSQLKSSRNEKQTEAQYHTSMYETNLSNDPAEKDQRRVSKASESVPLNEKPAGINKLDVYTSDSEYQSQKLDKDTQQELSNGKDMQFSVATANVLTWIIRIIILVLQLDLCLKYIRGLYYTWKGFQKRHNPKWARFYLTKQILIDADIALLRVFDCFMDSGSQVTLQLYIMLRLGSTSMKFDNLFLKQCLSIVSSLGSLAYALSGYSRCWRHMQLTHSPQGWPKGKPAPQLVSWWSTIIQWVWYLFLITPRVLALAMFAATFRSWFWIIIFAHWCGMLFWVLRFRTIFCISDQTKYNPREAIFEKCYNLVCSYIFIFCYMNLRKGDTRAHYIGFYTIYYIENIAFSIIYAIHSAETNLVLKYSLVLFVCCGFWVAVSFQFCYYRFLHPSTHVRLSTKRNISAFVHTRTKRRSDQLNKSKSCEDIIAHAEHPNPTENNELIETTSLHFDNSIDERWHNRFSKENRQKLIFQQQVIDEKVKMTRAQKQLKDAAKRQRRSTQNFFTRLSSPFKRSPILSTTPVIHSSDSTTNPPSVSTTRSHQPDAVNQPSGSHTPDKQKIPYQQSSHIYDIDEDIPLPVDDQTITSVNTNNAISEGGNEMILTAAKLVSDTITPLSSSAVNNNTTLSLPTMTD